MGRARAAGGFFAGILLSLRVRRAL